MAIVTHPANDAYRNNWEETFGNKAKTETEIHNIYCEAQGPVAVELDHVTSPLIQSFEEVGEPDDFGGRQIVATGGAFICCNKCGARLRQYRLQ